MVGSRSLKKNERCHIQICKCSLASNSSIDLHGSAWITLEFKHGNGISMNFPHGLDMFTIFYPALDDQPCQPPFTKDFPLPPLTKAYLDSSISNPFPPKVKGEPFQGSPECGALCVALVAGLSENRVRYGTLT